jgi:amino acid permease
MRTERIVKLRLCRLMGFVAAISFVFLIYLVYLQDRNSNYARAR